MLVTHAEHEEVYVQPVVEEHAPSLAGEIIRDHRELEARAAALEVLADRAVDACPADARLGTVSTWGSPASRRPTWCTRSSRSSR